MQLTEEQRRLTLQAVRHAQGCLVTFNSFVRVVPEDADRQLDDLETALNKAEAWLTGPEQTDDMPLTRADLLARIEEVATDVFNEGGTLDDMRERAWYAVDGLDFCILCHKARQVVDVLDHDEEQAAFERMKENHDISGWTMNGDHSIESLTDFTDKMAFYHIEDAVQVRLQELCDEREATTTEDDEDEN